MEDQAHDYISSLLNHNLRIHATDGRIFWGSFKCTDPNRNIVLANSYEYRRPSAASPEMTSRFLGLIVVPGEHIVRIEAEQFASQMNNAASS